MTLKLVVSVALLSISAGISAQENGLYDYQDLSHLFYARTKDSIKRAWTCRVAFKDKAAQKKYKEIWDQRTETGHRRNQRR